jgi:hypothetical protein
LSQYLWHRRIPSNIVDGTQKLTSWWT